MMTWEELEALRNARKVAQEAYYSYVVVDSVEGDIEERRLLLAHSVSEEKYKKALNAYALERDQANDDNNPR